MNENQRADSADGLRGPGFQIPEAAGGRRSECSHPVISSSGHLVIEWVLQSPNQ
jgi:hypothetical protein